MKKVIKKIYTFTKYNHHKRMSFEILILSAYYWAMVLMLPTILLHKKMGKANEESIDKIPMENYKDAAMISRLVNRICDITPWDSKCLVRAMIAKRLLVHKKISCTIYLGVGKEGDKMKAHAWVRSGEMFVTGGNGKGYAKVACFRN